MTGDTVQTLANTKVSLQSPLKSKVLILTQGLYTCHSVCQEHSPDTLMASALDSDSSSNIISSERPSLTILLRQPPPRHFLSFNPAVFFIALVTSWNHNAYLFVYSLSVSYTRI